MVSPNFTGSPNRYTPNPVDDRKLTGDASATYLALANAIEEVTDNIPNAVYKDLNPSVRRSVRSAENALRRAAYGVVVYAPEPTE